MISEITQKEIRDSYSAAENLKDLILLLEQQAQSKDCVICRMWLNDMSLSESDEKRFAETNVSEIKSFKYELQRPIDLLNAVVENWTNQLPLMLEINDSLSFILRERGVEGHLSDFVNLIDSCQFLVESLISIRTLSTQNKTVASQKWTENEQFMSKAIQEALQAFEKKDFVLLADVLEYDLGQALQVWAELLRDTGTIDNADLVDKLKANHDHKATGEPNKSTDMR